jgi:hypothetical protein
MASKLPASSQAAERMRRYRKRRRNGLRCVRLDLHQTEIDALIKRGLLPKQHRERMEAIELAVMVLICRVLNSCCATEDLSLENLG